MEELAAGVWQIVRQESAMLRPVTANDAENDGAGEIRDAAAIRTLSHPLRIRILGSLRQEGDATSAMLAQRLHTNSGQTSFHLRKLHDGGFVEEIPEKGTRRERWWKAATASTIWRLPSEYASEASAAMSEFERAANVVLTQLHNEYLSERSDWSSAWVDAAGTADTWIRITPARLIELRNELEATIQRFDMGNESAPDASGVVVLVNAFPRRSSSERDDSPPRGGFGFVTRDATEGHGD